MEIFLFLKLGFPGEKDYILRIAQRIDYKDLVM